MQVLRHLRNIVLVLISTIATMQKGLGARQGGLVLRPLRTTILIGIGFMDIIMFLMMH